MSTTSHPDSCRCSLHIELEARRHDCYRQLANAILGPTAPRNDDTALAHALAEHAQLLRPSANITPIRRRLAV
ncbi:MAG: hypothetical protein LC797_02385 [Chloroflexi bacterium]|nr:hypothetical protein [Chloroflexota bacterium]